MPSFTVPLYTRTFDPDPAGPIRRLLSPRIPVAVMAAVGRFVGLAFFVVDTGASHTVISAAKARAVGIPFPAETTRLGMVTAAGSQAGRVHDGELRVRFPQLPGHLFRLFRLFSEDIPPSVPPVFGLHDFLDAFRLALDGTPRPGALVGAITLDTVT